MGKLLDEFEIEGTIANIQSSEIGFSVKYISKSDLEFLPKLMLQWLLKIPSSQCWVDWPVLPKK